MRLIDVVMILLLGFIQSSTIIHRNEIKLPAKTGRRTPLNQKSEILPINIRVVPGDTTIETIDPDTKLTRIYLGQFYCYYLASENDKIHRIRFLENLEDFLLRTRASYDSVIVIIKPDSESVIQGTINLIDICRRHGFKRKFQYKEE